MLDSNERTDRLTLKALCSKEHVINEVLKGKSGQWKSSFIILPFHSFYSFRLSPFRSYFLSLSTRFTILDILTINTKSSEDLINKVELLSKSEARVMLLYCSKGEATRIMNEANKMKLTGKNYIWIVTQSVVSNATSYIYVSLGFTNYVISHVVLKTMPILFPLPVNLFIHIQFILWNILVGWNCIGISCPWWFSSRNVGYEKIDDIFSIQSHNNVSISFHFFQEFISIQLTSECWMK